MTNCWELIMGANQPTAVRAAIEIPLPPPEAWHAFVALKRWWPRAYTWSGDALVDIALEPWTGGRCFEIGPDGFHLDWGRVRTAEAPSLLSFAWQIGPTRVPEPNPDRASSVTVSFEASPVGTRVAVVHDGFANHGDGASDYAAALASRHGWPYMLGCYTDAVAP